MIKIGEYIRTTEGYIYKVRSKEHLDFLKWQDTMIGEIKVHSKNIVNLIEPYDLINGLIVEEVQRYPADRKHLIRVNGEFYTEDNIKTILTHEQYEQNCYRVEE